MPILRDMNPPNMNPEDSLERWLIIKLLKEGKLNRRELKERIRSKQKEEFARFGAEPHTDGTYDKWIRDLKKRGIIQEFNKELRLTALGKWLANSNLDSLFGRDSFLHVFIYKKCSSPPDGVVLVTPLVDTIDESKINVRGLVWVDLKCPRCGTLFPQNHLRPKDELVKFYNQAIVELGQFVKLEAQRI